MKTTKIERLEDVALRQAVITNTMATLMDENEPDTLVKTTTMETPFGNYLIEVEVVPNPIAAIKHWGGNLDENKIQSVLDALKAKGLTDSRLGLLEDQEPRDPMEEQQMIAAAIKTYQGFIPEIEGVNRVEYFDIFWCILMERINNPTQVIVPNN